jgi:hypothetical protein
VYNYRKIIEEEIQLKRIISFILAMCIGFAFTGCSSGNKPETAVDNYFKAVKECNSENLKATVQYTDEVKSENDFFADKTFSELYKKNGSMIKYKINSSTVNGDEAKVKVNCTYGDATELFQAAMGAYMKKAMETAFSEKKPSQEDMQKMLTDEIQAASKSTPLKPVTKDIEINCKKTDDKWKVVVDQNSINIMSANIYDTVKKMTESLNGQEKSK